MRTGERMKGNDDRAPRSAAGPGLNRPVPGRPTRTWLWVVAMVVIAALAAGTIFAWQRGQRDDAVAAVTFQQYGPRARRDAHRLGRHVA